MQMVDRRQHKLPNPKQRSSKITGLSKWEATRESTTTTEWSASTTAELEVELLPSTVPERMTTTTKRTASVQDIRVSIGSFGGFQEGKK